MTSRFVAEPAFIKKRIESLIEREYVMDATTHTDIRLLS